jgi:hypothetical protein
LEWVSFELSFLFVRRTISNATWAEIRTAYASGIGLREIARNMGIPEGTVLARAKREGWTHEIQSAKALGKREDAVVATPVEAAAMSMQQRGERHVERIAGVSERGFDLISDGLPFGRLWYGEPNAANNAIGYAKHYSHSHDGVIRVYDDAGNVVETHERHRRFQRVVNKRPPRSELGRVLSCPIWF